MSLTLTIISIVILTKLKSKLRSLLTITQDIGLTICELTPFLHTIYLKHFLAGKQTLFTLDDFELHGVPDGLNIDSEGNLYLTVNGGGQVGWIIISRILFPFI